MFNTVRGDCFPSFISIADIYSIFEVSLQQPTSYDLNIILSL